MSDVTPFASVVTNRARADIAEALQWLGGLSDTAAPRFLDALNTEIKQLCSDVTTQVANQVPLSPDALASIHFARPVFKTRFQTGKGRNRLSSAGRWMLYYDLADQNGDGQPDTIRILALYHAAARGLALPDDAAEG